MLRSAADLFMNSLSPSTIERVELTFDHEQRSRLIADLQAWKLDPLPDMNPVNLTTKHPKLESIRIAVTFRDVIYEVKEVKESAEAGIALICGASSDHDDLSNNVVVSIVDGTE